MKRYVCLLLALLSLLLCGCGAQETPSAAAEPVGHMELEYAERFSVDYYPEDAAVVTLGEDDRYLLLHPDAAAPQGLEALPVIRYPVERAYLASSAVPDLFVQMDALDTVAFTGTERADWKLPAVCEAMDAGAIRFAGKYGAPDYELLLETQTDLVVENTMIFHTPEVLEKLQTLGLPVIVEYSSYEPHPLGRVEWVKLYGLLTGHLDEAEAFFEQQAALVRKIPEADTGRTAAFFHITPNGAVVVRRQADYIPRMIALAGGSYALTELPETETALSTVTIQMESFYAQAKDADVLIYNSTVAGELNDLDDLLALSPLFAEFRAVQNGAVWCTEQSMYQRSSAAAGIIADLYRIFSGEADGTDQLEYLHRLK